MARDPRAGFITCEGIYFGDGDETEYRKEFLLKGILIEQQQELTMGQGYLFVSYII